MLSGTVCVLQVQPQRTHVEAGACHRDDHGALCCGRVAGQPAHRGGPAPGQGLPGACVLVCPFCRGTPSLQLALCLSRLSNSCSTGCRLAATAGRSSQAALLSKLVPDTLLCMQNSSVDRRLQHSSSTASSSSRKVGGSRKVGAHTISSDACLLSLSLLSPPPPCADGHQDLQQSGAPAAQGLTLDLCAAAGVETDPPAAAAAPPVASSAAGPEPADGRVLRNQFNFTERGCQTASHLPQERATATEPPHTATTGNTCSQWGIFDSYCEDQERQRAQVLPHTTRPGQLVPLLSHHCSSGLRLACCSAVKSTLAASCLAIVHSLGGLRFISSHASCCSAGRGSQGKGCCWQGWGEGC